MLRFDENPSQRPRNYLLRSEQSRLLMMVTSLALVGVLMQQLRGREAEAFLDSLFGRQEAVVAPPALEVIADQWPPGQGAAQLDAAQFAAVRDNTFFRSDEQDAWFYTFGQLQSSGPPAYAPTVTYAQLVSQPEAYRGRAIKARGVARRIEAVTPAENDLGIERLFRVTVQPDGGEVWPVTLYCLTLPEGVQAGDELNLPLSAVGYFFKKESYRWRDGLGITPVILSNTFRTQPVAATPAAQDSSIDPVEVFLTAGLISVLLIGFFFARSGGGLSRGTPAVGKIEIDVPDEES